MNNRWPPFFFAALAIAGLLATLFAPPVLAAPSSPEGDRLLAAGGQAYQKGNLAEAARLWEDARAMYARTLGEDHPDTLSSMHNLAITYRDLGQHD